ncbi:MAG: TIGR04282 family arsenosugar biosynthesis glycosyltransferase, partial [Ferruginibacter sp.]
PMKEALIIFVRNPELGKIKTRLAAGIGNEKALRVYEHLLLHTRKIAEEVPVTKFIFYADYINDNDLWNSFEKRLQTGDGLGARMNTAFNYLFSEDFTNVCIVGSDCYELTSDIIKQAFDQMKTNDVVIGPVLDGGYYLLGMNKMIPQLFINKTWSTDTVFSDTLEDVAKLNLTVHQLSMLSDIDNENDLHNSGLAYFV